RLLFTTFGGLFVGSFVGNVADHSRSVHPSVFERDVGVGRDLLQFTDYLPRMLKPFVRSLIKTSFNYRFELRRRIDCYAGEARHLLLQYGGHRLGIAPALPRTLSGNHLLKDATQKKNNRAEVYKVSPQHIG